MTAVKSCLFCLTFFSFFNTASALPQGAAHKAELWGGLEPGPYTVGFQLLKKTDGTRFAGFETLDVDSGRPVRVYLWYPARATKGVPLGFEAFARMAAQDFYPLTDQEALPLTAPPLPVPLVHGRSSESLQNLMNQPTTSHQKAKAAKGCFPLVILGQGLYYESPLSQLILSEYLASHGYVVATCPLQGAQSRLVNLNVEDLEATVRDLEFALETASELGCVDPRLRAAVGFDLGGMAALTLAMRHPEIDALVSFDSGILYPHHSGLPQNHFSYDESRFTIPWMHASQDRFIQMAADRGESSLMDRKTMGDGLLCRVRCTNHGAFSAYAMLGIEQPVTAYWGPTQEEEVRSVHEAACRCLVLFLDAYVKKDEAARSALLSAPQSLNIESCFSRMIFKAGAEAPPSPSAWIDQWIRHGVEVTLPQVQEARAVHADSLLFDQEQMAWLGMHFLYWWGRPQDALALYKLMTEIDDHSANAHDGLGRALLRQGDTAQALIHFKRALKLNPGNANLQSLVQQLEARLQN